MSGDPSSVKESIGKFQDIFKQTSARNPPHSIDSMDLKPSITPNPLIPFLIPIQTTDGSDGGFGIRAGNGVGTCVVSHTATGQRKRQSAVTAHPNEILGLIQSGQRSVAPGESLDLAQSRMTLPFDDDGMHLFNRGSRVGDDGTLGNLPVSVELAVAELVDSDRDAVEVEAGELAITRGA